MLTDRFLELLTKRLADELDETELHEFEQLLESSAECRRQYRFFKDFWVPDDREYDNTDAMFGRIRSKIALPEASVDQAEEELPVQKSQTASYLFRIAAALAIVLGGFWAIRAWQHKSAKPANADPLQISATPVRSRSKITLSDGSEVTLNAVTSLKFPSEFKGNTREVYLDGEAFFDVKKDAAHPFIVHAGKMSIRVLGTAFNIKAYGNDVASETTLIRGAIEVTLADRPNDRIILKPNEKLVLKRAMMRKLAARPQKGAMQEDTTTNYALTNLTHLGAKDSTVVETLWLANKLVFKDEDFGAVANKMERWYGVKFKFRNHDARDYHFTGLFEKENLSQALDALKMIEPFTYKLKNETVYIY